MKKKLPTKAELVKKYYPNSYVEKGDGIYWIISTGMSIGRGATPSEAWRNAFNQYVKD